MKLLNVNEKGLKSLISRYKIIIGIVFMVLISCANAVEFEISLELSLSESLGLEKDASYDQIDQKIKSNIIEQVGIISSNQDQLLEIIKKWNDYSENDIIIFLSKTNEDLNKINSWLRILKYAEDKRHEDTQTNLKRFLDWLGFYDKAERIRVNKALEQIESIAIKNDNVKQVSNQLINSLINKKTKQEHDELIGLTNLIAELISDIGDLTNLDYIDIDEGINAIVLPKQPSDSSIEAVMDNVSFSRIDYYDTETGSWLIYVPEAPGNTLHELVQNKVYWIYSNQKTRVHIK